MMAKRKSRSLKTRDYNLSSMHAFRPTRHFWRFLLPGLFLLMAMLPISGYRHLWQDEIETAERARSIVADGLPHTTDPEGRLSLNTGGREVEEGALHRYTPWGQYYAGAAGLLVGASLRVSPDAAVRTPFIFAHALSTTLLTYGLHAIVGLPALPALAIGSLFGLQSSRILHNRTCRYHALLDLLTVIGMLGLGLASKGRGRLGGLLLALAVFFLPQVHTLGGSLLASLLTIAAILSSLFLEKPGRAWKTARGSLTGAIQENLLRAILPALTSLAILLFITRPWLQGAWSTGGGPHSFRSVRGFEIEYAFFAFGATVLYLLWSGGRRLAFALLLLLAYVFLAVRLLDLHPFSQTRYYLAVPIFFLFWPLALPWPTGLRPKDFLLVSLLLIGTVLPEVQGVIPPWQGVRILAADWRLMLDGKPQPFRQAMELIASTRNTGPVLVDYVPQFANWYLPENQIALMPEARMKTALNERNPMWQKPLLEPEWHVAFLTSTNGQWTCTPDCDSHSEGFGPTASRYLLRSKSLGRAFEMCVVGRWRTDRWNNAPFSQFSKESYQPEGIPRDELTLARRCQGTAPHL